MLSEARIDIMLERLSRVRKLRHQQAQDSRFLDVGLAFPSLEHDEVVAALKELQQIRRQNDMVRKLLDPEWS